MLRTRLFIGFATLSGNSSCIWKSMWINLYIHALKNTTLQHDAKGKNWLFCGVWLWNLSFEAINTCVKIRKKMSTFSENQVFRIYQEIKCVFINNFLTDETLIKTSLTFKCLIEHLLADFSYSRLLDTYLWKQMMKMNRNITYKWCNIAKKHLLFTKRKCHKFSWLFTASCYSPRRRSICTCRIACKVLVSIGL